MGSVALKTNNSLIEVTGEANESFFQNFPFYEIAVRARGPLVNLTSFEVELADICTWIRVFFSPGISHSAFMPRSFRHQVIRERHMIKKLADPGVRSKRFVGHDFSVFFKGPLVIQTFDGEILRLEISEDGTKLLFQFSPISVEVDKVELRTFMFECAEFGKLIKKILIQTELGEQLPEVGKLWDYIFSFEIPTRESYLRALKEHPYLIDVLDKPTDL